MAPMSLLPTLPEKQNSIDDFPYAEIRRIEDDCVRSRPQGCGRARAIALVTLPYVPQKA